MAREFSRTQRIGDFLHQELARLIQQEVRDPRASMVSVTGVDVSKDLAHARVYFTQLGVESGDDAKAITTVLNKASGFLRSQIASSATLRTVPRLQFRFDDSIDRGRSMEALLERARAADDALRSDPAED